jgi:hypothetical protein
LVSCVKRSTEAEAVSEQGAEEVLLAMRKKVGGRWRKFHNEQLHNVYFSLNVPQMTKPRRIRCVGM